MDGCERVCVQLSQSFLPTLFISLRTCPSSSTGPAPSTAKCTAHALCPSVLGPKEQGQSDCTHLLAHAHHHTGVLRLAHDGGEHGARRIVSGEPSLHHPRTIIADQRRDLSFLGHPDWSIGYLQILQVCQLVEAWAPKGLI
eukprot:1150673-Pelagomonas_calceolata.AAC.3